MLDKIVNSAATRLIEAGKTVWIAMPDSINGQKTDFNDMLRVKGIQDIIKTITAAEKYHAYQPKLTQDKVDGLLCNVSGAIDIQNDFKLGDTNTNFNEHTVQINKEDVAKSSRSIQDSLINDVQHSLDRSR